MSSRPASFLRGALIRGCLLLAGLGGLSTSLQAQFVFSESFTGTTADGWVFGAASGSPFSPVLTAAAGIDAPGAGWLRMTDLQANEATYARLTTPIPSANNSITVALDMAMWDQGTNGAADGFTISLRDASVPFSPGAYGGSLGYANRVDGGVVTPGMAGGYFSLGIDNWGNYSNPTEGRNGGIGFTPNAIATRGPESTGYAYLGGTTDLSGAPYNLGQLDFPTYNSRPNQNGADYRQIVFTLDTDSLLTVSLKLGATGTLTQIYTADLSSYARPENLELVYTGSTGGAQQVIEIRNLSVTTTSAPVGNIYYSNYAGDNQWGNGQNWGNATTPNLGTVPANNANLIFSNNLFTAPNPDFQLTTAQNVDLGANRQAASIQFDAPFNYTLQGHQLTLDAGANPTAITVTSAQPGGAHTISSDVVLGSDLNINTNTNTALVLSGDIAAGAHTFTLNNLGTTTFSGAITGSGTMTQTAAGTTVISGNSAATYTGAINIARGTLQLGGSNVLNAATNLSLSSTEGAGTFNLANHDQTLGSLTFASGGSVTTGTGTLTLGGNVASSASATQATIAGNVDLGASNRTFNIASGGADPDMAISAAVTGAGGIAKTGAGTLLLSGDNAYAGSTTISAGTVIAAHDNALGTTGATTTTTVASGTTLGLQGGINLSAQEALTLNGTGDTGRAGALDNISGDNTVSGNITLASNTRFGAATGSAMTIGGMIGQSGGNRTLTINGNGTVVLANSNSYAGVTTVNSGSTLVAAANAAMGTTTGNTVVSSGATLGFQGDTNYSTTEAVTIAGTGASGRNGAIDNLSGNNTFMGAITMSANSRIGAADNSQLTLGGVLGQAGGNRSLTIGGTGTVVLGNANTYRGTTTVNSGATVVAASNSAFGTTTNGTTVANGATLGFQGNVNYTTTETLSVRGTGAAGRSGAIENISGTNSFSGAVSLAAATTIASATGSQLTLAGVVSGAQNLTKAGGGTLVLSAANTYSGSTTVSEGTLRLAGNGTIASTTSISVIGATFQVDNSTTNNNTRIGNTTGVSLSDGTLTFVGNGSTNTTETFGNLTLASGANTLNLATGAANRRLDVTVTDIIRNGSSTLVINAFSDAGMTTRSSLGQSVNGSPRVFVGTNNFNSGTGPNLNGASTSAPIALPGWITTVTAAGSTEFTEYSGDAGTGNGIRAVTAVTGGAGININDPTKVVQLSAADDATPDRWRLRNPGPTQVANGGGTLNGTTTVDGALKLLDIATVDLNTNANYELVLYNGGLLKSGATTTNFNGSGRLTSGNGFLAITVDNAGGTLNLTAPIVNNSTNYGTTGALGLNKSGDGLLILGGTNTYTGSNFLNGGTVRIANEANLGATSNDVTFAGGRLNVTSSFTSSTNKIFTIAANQTGTLDIDSGATLTLGNQTNVFTTANTAGLVIKDGDGTLVVQNANSNFNGSLQVNAGTVQIRNAQSLGDATNRGRVTLAGGTLDLRNNASTAFSNNITVTADSGINVDRVSSGTNLTHTLGTLAIGTNTLTVSGGNGFDLTLGATTLSGAATFNVTTAGSDLALGAVSGAGSLAKTGAGTLVLTGTNSYTGATTVDGGILRISANGDQLPSATNLTVTSGTFDMNGLNQTVASLAGAGNVTMGAGNLTLGSSNTSTAFTGVISGTGGVTKNGTGTLTLGGANTFTGALAINQGSIAYSASDVVANSVAVTVASGAALSLGGNSDTIGSLAGAGAVQLGSGTLTAGGNNASTTFSGSISGSGNVAKQGTGTMTLSGSSSYGGTTTVSAGVLAITNSSALGAGSNNAATGTTVASGATLRLSGAINLANEALTLSGTGASSAGALQNLSGNNAVGGPISLGNGASIVVNSGNLSLNNTVSNNGHSLTIDGSGNTLAYGAVTGTGSLTKNGAGALVFNATGNSYSGATALNAGTIQIGANNAGPASSAFTLASGTTLDVNNKTAEIGSLAGSANSSVVLGTGTLTAGGNGNSTFYAGVVSGIGGNFNKAGTGTLTFYAAQTYTGATTVSGGTLATIVNNGFSNQSAVTVQTGAALTFNDTTQNLASLAGGGTVNLGTGQLVTGVSNATTTFSGSITGTGSMTKVGSGNFTLGGQNTYTGTTTVNGGTLTLGANNALSNSTSVTVANGATLAVAPSVTDTVAGLTTNATSTISLATGAVLTIDRASPSTLLGNVTGSGTLAFTGGGNLTIGNALNFSNGTLAFGGTTIGGTPTSTLFLGSSLTLDRLHITGDTILDFGNSSATVLSANRFTIDAGVKVTIRNWVEWQDYFYVFQTWDGAVIDTRGQGSQTQVTFENHTPAETAWQTELGYQITPTPEPSTYGLIFMSVALSGFAWRRWRKRKAA